MKMIDHSNRDFQLCSSRTPWSRGSVVVRPCSAWLWPSSPPRRAARSSCPREPANRWATSRSVSASIPLSALKMIDELQSVSSWTRRTANTSRTCTTFSTTLPARPPWSRGKSEHSPGMSSEMGWPQTHMEFVNISNAYDLIMLALVFDIQYLSSLSQSSLLSSIHQSDPMAY